LLDDTFLNKYVRRGAWIAVILGAAVLTVIATEPFVPTTFGFRADDPVRQAQYERIVKAHGYSLRYEDNVRGEAMAMIDDITPRDYRVIECEYFRWSAQRDRAAGIIVYDRDDCAP
jgi:hypothetical protein